MISRFNGDNHAKNLPDAYKKTPESNNAKLLQIEKDAVDLLRETISAVYDSLDIDKAKGKTLDLYGEMFGQPRGTASDERYRILIKNRIIRNRTNADYNGIINALCMTFGCAPSEIRLVEFDDPCKVKLEGVPIAKLNENDIDINTAAEIVRGLIPVGVMLEALNFTGTFEFSDGDELVYDEKTGFADIEQTIGGYLGLMSGSNESTDEEWLDKSHSAVLGKAIIGWLRLGES